MIAVLSAGHAAAQI